MSEQRDGEQRDGEIRAGERTGPDAQRPDGTNGAFVPRDDTRAPFVPTASVAQERTPYGALVEAGILPDGRAIRFFSWAPDAEWAPIMVDRAPAGPPAPTRREVDQRGVGEAPGAEGGQTAGADGGARR